MPAGKLMPVRQVHHLPVSGDTDGVPAHDRGNRVLVRVYDVTS